VATRVVTVNDILDGHVGLDLECFDRIYLNGWVPNLQVSGQVVNFLTHQLGFPIPSPAILEKIGLRFRRAVIEYAAANDIAVIRFAKGERKLEVMRPHLDRLARQGRCGVAAIGVAQEFQRVFTGTTYHAFNEQGFAALDPRWSGGRPRKFGSVAREIVCRVAKTAPAVPVPDRAAVRGVRQLLPAPQAAGPRLVRGP